MGTSIVRNMRKGENLEGAKVNHNEMREKQKSVVFGVSNLK